MFESLTAALQAVYPTVEQLVGHAFFRHAARRYHREPPVAPHDLVEGSTLERNRWNTSRIP